VSGARAMIEARGVTKRFGAVTAVDDVSFTVREGEIVGFLGPNGAGKTTTLRMLAGIFPPSTGAVRIAGHDPVDDPLACRRAVGYFPEFAPYYPELSVAGYLRFVARLKRVPRATRADAVARALAACSLDDVAHRRVGTLSKGYRQRVGLAQALCGDPPILVLDEPTIGLDPAQVVDIRERVAALRGSRTVLFSSHILSEVEALCERVIVIAKGRIVGEGTPAELSARLGRRRRVVVRVDAPAEVARAALGAVDGVATVRDVAGAWLLETAGEGDLVAAVGDAVRAHGWTLRELREERLDLEEIFLELVGSGAR
jgi:ABC-2 type transport system ATP-binding protein